MTKKLPFLATTALPESWNTKEPMLFLGEWCKFHPKIFKVKNKFSVIKKHYCSDEARVYQNYKYISKLYEKLLFALTKTLNEYHGVKFSSRYWRILLGPWLGTFLPLVHDRWLILKKINYKKKISGTYILKIPEEGLAPVDKEEFDILRDDDVWNHFIFSKILQEIAPKKLLKEKLSKYSNINVCRKYFLKQTKMLPSNIFEMDSTSVGLNKKFNLPFYKNQKIFIKNSHLGFKNEILLNSMFFSWPTLPAINNFRFGLKNNFDSKIRNSLNLDFIPFTNFEKFIAKLIKIQIPQMYLESFKEANNFVKNCPWPKSPKVIFTSNMLWSNSCDIFYVTNMIEKNKTKLINGQHGGVYGQYKYGHGEEHEIKVSDKYLSWGWKRKNCKNLVPFGMLTTVPINTKVKNKKKVITILNKFSHRYSINLQPGLDYSRKINFFNDLGFILKNLKKKIPNKCLRVLSSFKYRGTRVSNMSWRIKDYLNREEIKNINFDDGRIPFLKKGIKNASLFIVLINSTMHLETLHGNYPTLIYFAHDNHVYSARALDSLNKLKKAKVFHSNVSSLTNHVIKIWPNVNRWWFSAEVQNAVKNYCNNFAKPVPNKIIKLKKIINQYM